MANVKNQLKEERTNYFDKNKKHAEAVEQLYKQVTIIITTFLIRLNRKVLII